MAEFLSDLIPILNGTLRLATPLILCAMAGLVSERSGVIDIGLEGKLLIGAFAAATVAALTGSAWLGLIAAIAASSVFSLIHGFACITHRGEQIISGVAVNFLALGLSVVIGIALFPRGQPPLDIAERFRPLDFPLSETLAGVPVLGPVYSGLLSGHNLLVYAALLAVPLIWWALYRTTFGLRLRAVGETPAAVDSAGVSVTALRYRGVLIAGVLCGIAGAYLSTAHGAGFVREMSAGKGFIALAAMIIGKWRPWTAFGACLLFGFLETITPRLQGVELPLIGEAPTALIPILPYIFTVILLAGFFGRAIPPRALGTPYVKEH
ncbi:MAG: ABC transporter permease [Pseudomonadota bacterium]